MRSDGNRTGRPGGSGGGGGTKPGGRCWAWRIASRERGAMSPNMLSALRFAQTATHPCRGGGAAGFSRRRCRSLGPRRLGTTGRGTGSRRFCPCPCPCTCGRGELARSGAHRRLARWARRQRLAGVWPWCRRSRPMEVPSSENRASDSASGPGRCAPPKRKPGPIGRSADSLTIGCARAIRWPGREWPSRRRGPTARGSGSYFGVSSWE